VVSCMVSGVCVGSGFVELELEHEVPTAVSKYTLPSILLSNLQAFDRRLWTHKVSSNPFPQCQDTQPSEIVAALCSRMSISRVVLSRPFVYTTFSATSFPLKLGRPIDRESCAKLVVGRSDLRI